MIFVSSNLTPSASWKMLFPLIYVEEINLLSNPALRDEDREEKNFLRFFICVFYKIKNLIYENK